MEARQGLVTHYWNPPDVVSNGLERLNHGTYVTVIRRAQSRCYRRHARSSLSVEIAGMVHGCRGESDVYLPTFSCLEVLARDLTRGACTDVSQGLYNPSYVRSPGHGLRSASEAAFPSTEMSVEFSRISLPATCVSSDRCRRHVELCLASTRLIWVSLSGPRFFLRSRRRIMLPWL